MEYLVGYAKHDLMVPLELHHADGVDLAAANTAAAAWCVEVNAAMHSGICAGASRAGGHQQQLLGALPSLRLEVPITRKVDTLSCVRCASACYSVPNWLIGVTVTVLVDEQARLLRVVEPV